MALARQAANLAKGRSRAAMVAAGEAAADGLAAMVQPFAGPTLRRSTAPPGARSCSPRRRPYDLVKPLADRLGLDDVVATRYGVNADGTYDGTLVGPFVWAAGKLEAVRDVGRRATTSTSTESYAYSDSFYDAPLLGAVGTPIVVNPDPRMVAHGDRRGAGRSSTSTSRRAS